MNERIRELALQAKIIDMGGAAYEGDNLREIQKFAELIIQDCVAQCEQVASHADLMAKSKFVTDEGRMLNEGMWGGAKNCGVWIKKHFGVE